MPRVEPIKFYVDPLVKEYLDHLSKKSDISRSALINNFFKSHLENKPSILSTLDIIYKEK